MAILKITHDKKNKERVEISNVVLFKLTSILKKQVRSVYEHKKLNKNVLKYEKYYSFCFFKNGNKKYPKGTYGQMETSSCICLRLPRERPFDPAYELNKLGHLIQVFSTGLY